MLKKDEDDDEDGFSWEEFAGGGTISGLMSRRTMVPAIPMPAERVKPALVRSKRYQRAGFTSERVMEAWRVERHASFRWRVEEISYHFLCFIIGLRVDRWNAT